MSVQQCRSNKSSPKFFLIKNANCNIFSTESQRTNPWLVGCLLLLLGFAEGCGNKSAAAAPAAPATVQVVEVAQRDVPVYHEWIATLDGYVNAIIQPQVSGYLVQQNYREGALVHKNEVLFKIDPRPFQAILDQAKAAGASGSAARENPARRIARYSSREREGNCPEPTR